MSFERNGGAPGAAEILDILGITRRSGKFQVVADSDAYAFHVARGRILYATSSLRTLRLGHVLLQRGAVQPVYLHDVLRGRRTISRDNALGAVLVRDGAITREDLAAGVEEQAIEVLTRLLALEAATYMYHAEEPIPAGIEIVQLDTARIVEEASRRVTERSGRRVIQRLLPPDNAELSLDVQLALVSHHLTDAELLVALNVDRGAATISRLERALPLDQLTLQRTLLSLLERGYVAVRAPRLEFDL